MAGFLCGGHSFEYVNCQCSLVFCWNLANQVCAALTIEACLDTPRVTRASPPYTLGSRSITSIAIAHPI